jgi:GNAT superfamily N-acetyltransferase
MYASDIITSMDRIKIVTLKPEEWQEYRDLRLRALKEDPQAYGSTYEENAKHPDEYWRKRLEDTLNTNTQWLVFAKLDDVLVGMVGAFAEKEPDNAHVIAVYVTPEARGKGISKLLMQELLAKIKTTWIQVFNATVLTVN